MMKNKKIIIILILVFIFLFIKGDISYASISESIKFKNLTIEDGLSQSTVENMYQDSKGYIWIATNDGLDRYNGYEFKHYKNDKYDKNTISNNYIIDVTEDKNGDIWVSTSDGISRINTITDEIKNYYSKDTNGNLSNSRVCEILSTKDNKIIAATVDGLNLYDEKDDKFLRILDKEGELPSQYINSVKEDLKGNIWIGTDKGLVEIDEDLNLLNKYEDTIGNDDVYSTYDDAKGNMWICTLGDGLFRINSKDNSVVNFKKMDNETSIISNNVRDVVLDSKGKLWIITEDGLCNFDYRKEVFTSYKKESYERDSILDDKAHCLLKDRSGLIWIGAYSGISVFNPNSNFFYYKSKSYDKNSLSGNIINSLYKDDDEILWVGTSENGVDAISQESTKHINKENSNLISNEIFDIKGFNNYIFIGTNDGLSVLEKTDDKDFIIKNYTDKDGLPSNKIRSLFIDSKGYLWIGTNRGIAILNIHSGEINKATNIFDKIDLSDKFIRAIHEDSNGNYYIGCFLEGGLIKINPKTKEYKIYKNDENDDESISNNTIRYITEDLEGNILVGTSYGINILAPDTDKFKHYTENDGLVNNTVYGIIIDKNNDIWMSTNGGISKFSIKDETFKNFTVVDGLQSNEFNGRSCFGDKYGYVYFGGINGLNIIDVDNIELSIFKPNVIFDSFEVNGISKKDISNKKFRYNENNIKVNFFTDDYKNTKGTKYYYRLKGSEEEWNVTNSNLLTFANLSSGDYTLEIKTMTQHGITGEANSINFTIKSPFWRSHYAIIIYWSLIILFIYIYGNKVKKLDKLVNKKTGELRNQLERNEKLFNKVIKLEKSKNNYFINLSHELRTPLNVLTSINQVIKSFIKGDKTISNEKLSYYMDVMNRNCNRLLNLINNLIDYEKIENNRYILEKEKVDIVYLVEETVFDMKDYIEENGIEFIFDTDVEEKLIECDKLDIERCVINLVSNATKFTPKGGLIEVTVYDLDDKVKISVKDSGTGISEENQKIIFDRFNQGIDKNSEQKGGSGLGLTITKQIINLHGGEIHLESKVDVGSEFIIILPVRSGV